MKNKDVKVVNPQEFKYKMSKEELETHLHIQRKGGVGFKSKKDYNRKEKYKKRSW